MTVSDWQTEYRGAVTAYALHPGTIRTAINAAAAEMPTPDTTTLAAATALHLTSGRIDWLHGR